MKIPKLDKYINDFSKVLSKQAHHELNESAAKIEREHSFQVVTVIFPHRQGRELKDIALEVFNENGIGQEGKNNGLLLIISSEEKKIRIMVGKGLEWIFTETWCRNIIERELRPLMNNGQYSELIQIWQRQRYNIVGTKYSKYLGPSIVFFFFGYFILNFLLSFLYPHTAVFLFCSLLICFIVISIIGILLNRNIPIIGFWDIFKTMLVIIIFNSITVLGAAYPAIVDETNFCESYPKQCIEGRADKDSAEYKKYIQDKYKSSGGGGSSKSSHSSSSSRSSSSSFQGGGGSSNGAGWGD